MSDHSINRNMSYEYVRPVSNRFDTLPKEQMNYIILHFFCYLHIVSSYMI